jgi:myosin heavy subunit
LKNVENDIISGMTKICELLEQYQNSSQSLSDSNLQQHQNWLNQTCQTLENAKQTLLDMSQQMSQFKEQVSEAYQKTQSHLSEQGSQLRQAMTSETQTALQHHQRQQQTLRQQMEESHQADLESIEYSQQQSRALIGQLAHNKLRLGMVMGTILGGLLLLMGILALMNHGQYKDWQKTRIMIDQSQKELTLLNQQINRIPIQYQAQALTDIQAVYGGGINITSKNPNNAVCQKNGFGYPTLYINPNPYYRPQ